MLTKNEYVVLPYPFSCCGCYDGRGFCSHMLGLFMFCYVGQQSQKKKISKEKFESQFPKPPHESQGEPVLIENMVRDVKMRSSKAQLQRRQHET